ncbi:pentatricopeptide repeat-containing protein At5g03800 [Phragmites australis]|uniref:pentatricopeptide repeat-containing protein At5g03800 n=1 Tax=Phragmites australis TaxID=29695 RepID=UPI002D78874C|nr:pentatricopeptide repeat-containing protein At5g03800 [Phragmites australis]
MAISTSSPSSPPPLPLSSPPAPPSLLSFPPPPHAPPPRLPLRAVAAADPGAAHAVAVKSGALGPASVSAADARAANAVMCAYLRAGRLADAREVFGRMPARDAASYSALISGHARLGSPAAAAAALLGRMRLVDGLHPTEYTFVGLLTACARRGNPRLGAQVHALAAKSGHGSGSGSSLLVDNTLLGMYVKCGRFGDALRAFDGMDRRDVSSWNTVLAGLVELGRHEEAFELFGEMQASGVRADRFSLSALLTAAAEGFGWPEGEAVHALSLKSGLEMDLSVGNALIGFYAEHGSSVEDVVSVFQGMPVKDVISWTGLLNGYMEFGLVDMALDVFDRMPQRNFVTYNAVLTGFCRNKEGVRVTFAKKAGLQGLGLFRRMVEDGLEISDVTVTGALNACAIAADRKASEQVHAFVVKCGCGSSPWIDAALIDMCIKCGRSGDAHLLFEQWRHQESFHIAWNSLLLASVRDGEYEKALSTFLQMFRSSGIHFIDEFMLTTVLGVCGALGFADLGKQMHSFAAKSGLLCARGVGNAIISMYGKCGELEDAVNLFEQMPCRDLVTWNALITAHLLHRQGEEILDIWDQMERLGIRPDSITFLLVISACSHTSSNSADKCRELFLSISGTYSIEPAMEHYAAFIYVLGCLGHFDEAEQLIGSMSFKPGALVWRSLLDSCSKRSNITVRRRAMKHLLALEPQDPSTYVLTSNLLSESARWHCSENTRLEMREKGMRKIPARSWTFHDNTVHSFFARDRSHQQSKDIYAGLDVLILECMKTGYEPDTSFVLHDVEEYQKSHFLMYHSAKLATMYGLLMAGPGQTVRVVKNIRMCGDCHSFLEYASAATRKEISVRDSSGFHIFRGGKCSCRG